jgi:hypothetical protein
MADSTGQYGTMKAVSTAGSAAATPVDLNGDGNGYAGDDAYSKAGTYIFWYDNVVPSSGGIGTIHAKRYDDVAGAGQVLAQSGFFVRQTHDDDVVAVMADTILSPDRVTHIGELRKVTLSSTTSQHMVDQITYLDMLYPSTSTSQIVYSRLDGVYVADF